MTRLNFDLWIILPITKLKYTIRKKDYPLKIFPILAKGIHLLNKSTKYSAKLKMESLCVIACFNSVDFSA